MKLVSQHTCADIYFGIPQCFMFTPKEPAFWVYDLEGAEYYERYGDYDAGWDHGYPTHEEAIARCEALDRLYGSL